jgi:hypothetical protein
VFPSLSPRSPLGIPWFQQPLLAVPDAQVGLLSGSWLSSPLTLFSPFAWFLACLCLNGVLNSFVCPFSTCRTAPPPPCAVVCVVRCVYGWHAALVGWLQCACGWFDGLPGYPLAHFGLVRAHTLTVDALQGLNSRVRPLPSRRLRLWHGPVWLAGYSARPGMILGAEQHVCPRFAASCTCKRAALGHAKCECSKVMGCKLLGACALMSAPYYTK